LHFDCIVLGFITSEDDPDAHHWLNYLILKGFDVEIGMKINVILSITPESTSITNKNGNERGINFQFKGN